MSNKTRLVRLQALEAELKGIARQYELWRIDMQRDSGHPDAIREVDQTIATLGALVTLLRVALPACDYIPF